MNVSFGGVWPVMLTPFSDSGAIDETGLRALVDWYIDNGVDGLFASCQSSEIFDMSYEERMRIARIAVDQAAGRVPVIGSGFTDYGFTEQVRNIHAMNETGADAVVLLTNRLACAGESDDVLLKRIDALLNAVDDTIDLGLYECPIPYKYLLTPKVLAHVTKTKRFYFIKDTCCNAKVIRERLQLIKGSTLKLFNANTTTLLESLRDGASGYSGIMANFHPELYVWLCKNIHHKNAPAVQHALTLASFIERQLYPTNAKYHLQSIEKLPITTYCRVQHDGLLNDTFKDEVCQMDVLMNKVYEDLCQ